MELVDEPVSRVGTSKFGKFILLEPQRIEPLMTRLLKMKNPAVDVKNTVEELRKQDCVFITVDEKTDAYNSKGDVVDVNELKQPFVSTMEIAIRHVWETPDNIKIKFVVNEMKVDPPESEEPVVKKRKFL